MIPDVYRKYKQFGSTDIQVRCRSLEEIQKGFEKEDRKRIEEVVDPKSYSVVVQKSGAFEIKGLSKQVVGPTTRQ